MKHIILCVLLISLLHIPQFYMANETRKEIAVAIKQAETLEELRQATLDMFNYMY